MYAVKPGDMRRRWKYKQCLRTQTVIGFPIIAESFQTQLETIVDWAQKSLSKVVCVANVHMLVEAKEDKIFASVLYRADMLTPDGMPLVWLIRWLKREPQDRVAGMELMRGLCQRAAAQHIPVFFLGSTNEVLDKMRQRLRRDFPELLIAGMESPPFRPLTLGEDEALVARINDSGAGLVFLALGCPKQECWMDAHQSLVKAVMVGVGGVFPIYAGEQMLAPEWIRESGLEWGFRLIQEPRRLWGRYSNTIPKFLWLAFKQVLKVRLGLDPDLSLREQL